MQLFFVFSLQKKAKAAADVEYPAYGVTGEFETTQFLQSGTTEFTFTIAFDNVFNSMCIPYCRS